MPRPLRLAALVLLLLCALAPARTATQTPPGPSYRLVLLVAVDQFRYDYLTRARRDFTGGLKRLLERGAVFSNAYLEHYPTVTAVGHATMLSGATPAVSGIIGNDWYDREAGASVTSVSDPSVQLVGAAAATGSSPHRLLVSTLGDELKIASRRTGDGAPRVIGVSLKDRSAILPVGRMADAAFWYDGGSGRFVTSTFYRPELPAWAAAFNDARPADAFAGRQWTFLDPSAGPGRALPADLGPALYASVQASPFGNDLVETFAIAALTSERLGQRGTTDVLSVSFSSNDSVGHTHGPDSAEAYDITVRTDQTLQRLFDAVDRLVGLDHTIVILTADHGVAPLPETMAARRMPGGRLTGEQVFGPIRAALEARFGAGQWILATAGSSPYLNHALIAEKGLDGAEVRRVAAAAAATVPHIARVYTREQLLAGAVPSDTIASRVARSYHAQRSGDLELILEPYWLRSGSGTTHGTPYSYDAHVPLILMGSGIRAGRYDAMVALNDLAPTLATLLEVETPSGSSGRVLSEIWERPAAPSGTR